MIFLVYLVNYVAENAIFGTATCVVLCPLLFVVTVELQIWGMFHVCQGSDRLVRGQVHSPEIDLVLEGLGRFLEIWC